MFGGLGGLFGGGGSSFSSGGIGNSDSVNDTASNDARITAGEGSTNVSNVITGGSNTLTDHAAVAGGIRAAMAGIDSATKLASQVQASQGSLLQDALGTVSDQQKGFTSALENIKTSDVRTLIITGMIVVGVVAAAMVWRKG